MAHKETIIAYKSLGQGGVSPVQGYGWPLPKDGKPGRWVTARGELSLCKNGVHACLTCLDLLRGQWLRKELYLIELEVPILSGENKCCSRRGRLVSRVKTWNSQTARLFAADCAEEVLHLNPDKRCSEAIRVARRYAFGLATSETMDAARAAAWDAAWAAAWDAARAAAWDAAWAAAWDAARAAAVVAQASRLHAYLSDSVSLEAIRRSVE